MNMVRCGGADVQPLRMEGVGDECKVSGVPAFFRDLVVVGQKERDAFVKINTGNFRTNLRTQSLRTPVPP